MVTTAKASLISQKSTLSTRQPAFASSLSMAPTGAVGKRAGTWACVVWPTMRASGDRPSFSAVEARISTSAAAPSEIDDEFAGVTVPSFLKAGFRVGILSMLALNGCSSRSTVTSPFFPATVTGAISQAKLPSLLAAWARVSERIAKASCASRLKA